MKNKQQILKRARNMVKGLVISWSDPDPLGDTTSIRNATVTHRNPVLRLKARQVFEDFGEWIMHRQVFRWLITIDVVFHYANGVVQRETRELEAVATITDLNSHCMEQIRDALRHGAEDRYTHTEFQIECLGSN